MTKATKQFTTRAALRKAVSDLKANGYADVKAIDNGSQFSGVDRWQATYTERRQTLSVSRNPIVKPTHLGKQTTAHNAVRFQNDRIVKSVPVFVRRKVNLSGITA